MFLIIFITVNKLINKYLVTTKNLIAIILLYLKLLISIK